MPSAGYEKSISGHGNVTQPQFLWLVRFHILLHACSSASQDQRANAPSPANSPVNSTVSPACDRGWLPSAGGGLRFDLLPLTLLSSCWIKVEILLGVISPSP